MALEVTGTCGTCTIRCVKVEHDNFLLEIAPTDPKRGGALDEWGDMPPWCELGLGGCVTKVMVCPGVKALTCRRMFFNFQRLKNADLSGLDVSDVTDMNGMFRSCLNLTSVDVRGWADNQLADMDSSFDRYTKATVLVKIRP